jgi:hypothetical protein
MDFGILAASCACAVSLVALCIELYKAAEDRPPPFPTRRERLLPQKSNAMVVEFSDGKAATLPMRGFCHHDATDSLTRFEQLLRLQVEHAAVR